MLDDGSLTGWYLTTLVCLMKLMFYIVSGVIDDRGKFIYISQSELNAFASFIKKRGRVSLTELAEHSNSLIVLDKPILST